MGGKYKFLGLSQLVGCGVLACHAGDRKCRSTGFVFTEFLGTVEHPPIRKVICSQVKKIGFVYSFDVAGKERG